MNHTSIVLIDDHPLFRRGLSEMFADSGDHEVVGQAAEGLLGIDLVLGLKPDCVLLDLHMPGMTGLQVLEELNRLKCECQVIVLTASLDRVELVTALRLGAQGFLLKDTDPEVLLDYVRCCGRGSAVLNESLVALLADASGTAISDAASAAHGQFAGLTEREKQTLNLLAHGLSNKLIARDLRISEGTVKVYVKNLMRKLQMRSRLELAAWVHQNCATQFVGGRTNAVH